MKLKKGDTVKIIAGKDRGKTGTIFRVLTDRNKVMIDGLNVVKKRSKPRKQGEKGQTVEVPRPLAASNVMLICASCKEPTRVGSRMDGAKKVRFCKKCEAKL
jgi:large subunit ribosomal protein L24